MINVNDTINKKVILTALDSKLKLHIKLTDGQWRNGYVVKVETDFFIFNDMLNGDEPTFFLQLEKVEPFVEGVRK